eukprot:4241428-Lingulodinium_polyedra.AAC.1
MRAWRSKLTVVHPKPWVNIKGNGFGMRTWRSNITAMAASTFCAPEPLNNKLWVNNQWNRLWLRTVLCTCGCDYTRAWHSKITAMALSL